MIGHFIGVDVTGRATPEAPAQAELRPTSAGGQGITDQGELFKKIVSFISEGLY
jgi:hypothetical protein